LIQHTLHDLTTLMQTSANTEALQSFKSKELLAEVGKFMVHEQLELRVGINCGATYPNQYC
jgi:hypothetical protein